MPQDHVRDGILPVEFLGLQCSYLVKEMHNEHKCQDPAGCGSGEHG